MTVRKSYDSYVDKSYRENLYRLFWTFEEPLAHRFATDRRMNIILSVGSC